MQVPSFKTKKIRKDIFELVDMAPTRGMYKIVMLSIDQAMDELLVVRERIPDPAKVRKMLDAWDKVFLEFGEREAFYYQAFLESDNRSAVDDPLFDGDYDEFDFDPTPTWPDIETPWRLANELSTAAVVAGADQDFLHELEHRFKDIISNFWEGANALIVKQKAEFEKQAANEPQEESSDEGRVFGFWPLVAVGAVALVGVFGAAAGYSASKGSDPDQYVEQSPFDKHLKKAKTVGLGVLIGIALAVVLMLRIRK